MSGGIESIRVISHLPQPLKGRYDGKDFSFLPGKPTDLSIDAARHIFGLGEDDKAPALNKLGLLIPGRPGFDTIESALEKLERITFMEGRTVFEDEEGADSEPTAARKGRGNRTDSRVPQSAGSSGETGDSQESPGAP